VKEGREGRTEARKDIKVGGREGSKDGRKVTKEGGEERKGRKEGY
jgi:hypothetical protein